MPKTIPPSFESGSPVIERFVARHLESAGELGALAQQLRTAAKEGQGALAVAHYKMWTNPTYQRAYWEEAQRGTGRVRKSQGTGLSSEETTHTPTIEEASDRAIVAPSGVSEREQALERATRGAQTHLAAQRLIQQLSTWFWELEAPPNLSPDFYEWGGRVPQSKGWNGDADDHLCALQLLRQLGWRRAIPIVLGFAGYHWKQGDYSTKRLRSIAKTDYDAYAAQGDICLKQQKVLLYSPLNGDTFRRQHVDDRIISLEELYAVEVRADNKAAINLDELPAPHAQYVGEAADRKLFSFFDEILCAPKPTNTSDDLESWKEILPEASKLLGYEITEKPARELFKKLGIHFEERHGRVCVSRRELSKLKSVSGRFLG